MTIQLVGLGAPAKGLRMDNFRPLKFYLVFLIAAMISRGGSGGEIDGLEALRLGSSLVAVEEFYPALRSSQDAFQKRHTSGQGSSRGTRSIYFVGDSTFRNQFQAICLGMGSTWNMTAWKPPNQASRPAVPPVREACRRGRDKKFTDKVEATSPPFQSLCTGMLGGYLVLAVHVLSLGFSANISRAVESVPSPWTRTPPDVVYFGAGQWLLWPVPFVENAVDWSTYDDWKCIEADVLAMTHHLLELGTARVVLSSAHPICDEDAEYSGSWANVFSMFRGNSTKGAQLCAELLARKFGAAARYETLLSQCIQGFRDNAGINHINGKLSAAVSKMNAMQNQKPGSSSIGFVDSHSLLVGHCDSNFPPSDRIHFVGLVFSEVESLLREVGWS